MAVEKIINLKVNDDIKDTEDNVVSLKRQLREAQQDVQTLLKDNTEAIAIAKEKYKMPENFKELKQTIKWQLQR